MRFLSKKKWIALAALLVAAAQGACSLYQSEGRKFLESQAFEYAGVQANLKSCDTLGAGPGGELRFTNERADVFQRPDQPLTIRVIPRAHEPQACEFQFNDPTELDDRLPLAIEFTWQHLRLGEFAN